MITSKSTLFFMLLISSFYACQTTDNYGTPVAQTLIQRIELMPTHPNLIKLLIGSKRRKTMMPMYSILIQISRQVQ